MFKKIYLIVINFLLLYFNVKSDPQDDLLKEKNNKKIIEYDENKNDRTKFAKIEIVFNRSKKDVFYFYLPKGTYNWNSFLQECKEFAENPEYSQSYKFIKDNKIFEKSVFKYDLYSAYNIEKKKKDLESKLEDHKLKGDFDINNDYSFGFMNNNYFLLIFRDCKLKDEYNKKYQEIRWGIKLGNYEEIMNKINDCFGKGVVLGIYSDEKCTKEITNEGENTTKVNEDFIYLKFKDECCENLPYDYSLKLDKIDKGKDYYSFYSKSSYDMRKNEQISIYDFFRDLCKNEIRYNNLRYNFKTLGGHLYSNLYDFDKCSSVLKKVIIIDKNGNKNEINNIECLKTTNMNKDYKYKFILYKNNNIIEFEYITEKGEETIYEKCVYDYRDYVPKSLKDILKDEIDVYGYGMLPLKVKRFNFLIKDNELIKILKIEDNKELELPIKNPDGTFNLDYPLSSGKYKIIVPNRYSKEEVERSKKEYEKLIKESDERIKKIDKILEEERLRKEKSCYNKIC